MRRTAPGLGPDAAPGGRGSDRQRERGPRHVHGRQPCRPSRRRSPARRCRVRTSPSPGGDRRGGSARVRALPRWRAAREPRQCEPAGSAALRAPAQQPELHGHERPGWNAHVLPGGIDRAGNISQPSTKPQCARRDAGSRGANRGACGASSGCARMRGWWPRAMIRTLPRSASRAAGPPRVPSLQWGPRRHTLPFTSRLPLSQFSGRVIELRAVAKDSSNKVDPSPASIHVLKEAIPSQPSATRARRWRSGPVLLDGHQPGGAAHGLRAVREGRAPDAGSHRWPGTASATSTAAGTPANAYDDAGDYDVLAAESPAPTGVDSHADGAGAAPRDSPSRREALPICDWRPRSAASGCRSSPMPENRPLGRCRIRWTALSRSRPSG